MTLATVAQFNSVTQLLEWLRQHCNPRARLCCDSRQVREGDIFFAWSGGAIDARDYLAQAFEQGAAAAVCESEGFSSEVLDKLTQSLPTVDWRQRIACLPDLSEKSAEIASEWLGKPSESLDVVAVTGTNGKTTVSWWLSHIMQRYQGRWGVVGTLGAGLLGDLKTTGLTSPQALQLQQTFADLRSAHASGCAIEASSIGIEQGRLNKTKLAVAALTNLTQDHLDYHGSMAAYAKAKEALFDWPQLQAAVINIQDAFGLSLAEKLLKNRPDVKLWTYGVQGDEAENPNQECKGQALLPRLLAHHAVFGAHDIQFELNEFSPLDGSLLGRVKVIAPVVGRFNLMNVLTVIGCMRALHVPLEKVSVLCADLPAVPGRMQSCGGQNQPLVVVDYAHTPDALRAVLQALQPVAQQRGGRLICVFGCGGDRDTTKRPIMAQEVERQADELWITSDNPRTENPLEIIQQIKTGLVQEQAKTVHVEPDRRQAIASAIASATQHDVILIAGKGHEDYQEINAKRIHFSDPQEATNALASWQERGNKVSGECNTHCKSRNEVSAP